MAGHAGRNAARRVAAAVQFLAGLPVGGIRLQAGIGQAVEIGAQIRHVVRVKVAAIGIMTGLLRLPSLKFFSCSAM